MIKSFVNECSYDHYMFRDCYFVVINSCEYDDHWMIDVIWKNRRDDSLIFNKSQRFSILKSKLKEFNTWQRK